MHPPQLNLACASFTNVDKMGLHTANPGNTGADDSGETKQTITWSTPSGGLMYATCTFTSISGVFTHVGLWDDDVFVEGHALDVTLPTTQDLVILVEHRVEVGT